RQAAQRSQPRGAPLDTGVVVLLTALLAVTAFLLLRDRRRMLVLYEELEHRSVHDPLTGLGNRGLLLQRLEEALSHSEAGPRPVTVLVIDLDDFKAVNDRLGHATGDRLLMGVAARVRACVGCRDTVVRLGGDEFAVLSERRQDTGEPAALAGRIQRALGEPFVLESRAVFLEATIGIAHGSAGDADRGDLVRDAEIAMHVAKAGSAPRVAEFRPSMYAAVLERLEAIEQLQVAVERGELTLHYQPVVALDSGRIVGVEALVRWQHPERGLVPPAGFIPLAEETDLIVPLGSWVLREACRQLGRWRERHRSDLSVSVNVSGRQLGAAMVADVAAALAETGLDPAALVLEITESVLMADPPGSLQTLRRLRALGVRIAVDDFGTGYSSLSRLREFPVHQLKIDRSFVGDISAAGESVPLVASILVMADSLGLEVVAEGVETVQQLAYLQRHGCDHAQGHLLSSPLNAEQFEELLRESVRLEAPAQDPGVSVGDADLDPGVVTLVAEALTPDDHLETLVRHLLAKLADVTGFESTYLTEILWDHQVQEIRYSHNAGELQVPEGAVVACDDIAWRRTPPHAPRSDPDGPGDVHRGTVTVGLRPRSHVGVPIVTGNGDTVGTLGVASASWQQLPPGAVGLMDLFARLLGDRLDERGQRPGIRAERQGEGGRAAGAGGRGSDWARRRACSSFHQF
ncbi:MAG: EAL domain-containing protein, partial [Actinomycetota bacterium]|nr:EAL domain-containing protein [Actinomycetota bacterium]